MEVHVLLQGVFGGQRFGADATDERLLSGVHALVDQQRVFLGKTLSTNQTPKGLLSWGNHGETHPEQQH